MSYTSRLSIAFIFLWSTAFIAFELCAPYVEPATFISLRVSLVAAVLLCAITVTRSNWPASWLAVFHSAVVGVLIHGVYAWGSFSSIYQGLSVGYCALILNLQPLLTVILSCVFLHEKITSRKLIGIIAGTLGVAVLVLDSQLANDAQLNDFDSNSSSIESVLLCVIALFAFTVATIYQKRFCSNTPLIAGGFIQYFSAAIFILPIALFFETSQIEWSLQFGLGLGWLVLAISTGATFILMYLIKNKDAGSVANLLYLVTPLVAIQAWILFDQSLSMISVLGILMCTAGVAVVNYCAPAKQNKSVFNRTKTARLARRSI